MNQVLEVLKKGMSTEIWGRAFYAQAAARTEDETGKAVFQSLFKEESSHLDILRGEYAAASGGKGWLSVEEAIALAETVDPTDIFPNADQAKSLIPEAATDEQALQLALDFERRGFEMYAAQAKKADSESAKRIWQFLADAEDKHFTFIQKTLDYLVSEGKWYFDDQELPIFYN